MTLEKRHLHVICPVSLLLLFLSIGVGNWRPYSPRVTSDRPANEPPKEKNSVNRHSQL